MVDFQRRSFLLDRAKNVTINKQPVSAYGAFVTSEGWSIGETKPVSAFTTIPGVMGSSNQSLTQQDGRTFLSRREITLHLACAGDPMQVEEAMHSIGGLNGTTVRLGGLDSRGEFVGLASVGAWDVKYTLTGRPAFATTSLVVNAQPYVTGERQAFEAYNDRVSLEYEGNVVAPVEFIINRHADAGGTKTFTLYHVGHLEMVVFTATVGPGLTTATLSEATKNISTFEFSLNTDWRAAEAVPGLNKYSCDGLVRAYVSPRWLL